MVRELHARANLYLEARPGETDEELKARFNDLLHAITNAAPIQIDVYEEEFQDI